MIAVVAFLGGGLAAVCFMILVIRRQASLVRGGGVDQQSTLSRQPIAYGVAIALGGLYVALRLLAG